VAPARPGCLDPQGGGAAAARLGCPAHSASAAAHRPHPHQPQTTTRNETRTHTTPHNHASKAPRSQHHSHAHTHTPHRRLASFAPNVRNAQPPRDYQVSSRAPPSRLFVSTCSCEAHFVPSSSVRAPDIALSTTPVSTAPSCAPLTATSSRAIETYRDHASARHKGPSLQPSSERRLKQNVGRVVSIGQRSTISTFCLDVQLRLLLSTTHAPPFPVRPAHCSTHPSAVAASAPPTSAPAPTPAPTFCSTCLLSALRSRSARASAHASRVLSATGGGGGGGVPSQ
jgi:hypothetical protein